MTGLYKIGFVINTRKEKHYLKDISGTDHHSMWTTNPLLAKIFPIEAVDNAFTRLSEWSVTSNCGRDDEHHFCGFVENISGQTILNSWI